MFKKIDLSQVKQLQEELNRSSSGGGSDYRWASLPKKGETMTVRFLPPVGEMTLPFFRVFKHYNVPDPENPENLTSYTCLRTWNMDCPVCNKLNELARKFGSDLVGDYFASQRGYFNVLIKDRPSEYTPNLPYILGMPRTGLAWVVSKLTDPDYGDITDPVSGFWVKITRKENNQLQFDIIPKPSPIENPEEVAKNCFDLTKIWRQPDDVYLQNINMVAQLLEEKIRAKVGLPTEVVNNQPNQVQVQTQSTTPTGTETPKAEAQSSVKAPPGAPPCFGSYNPEDKKCVLCTYDLECKSATGG